MATASHSSAVCDTCTSHSHPCGPVGKGTCKRVAGREAGWGGFGVDRAQLCVFVSPDSHEETSGALEGATLQ